MAVVTFNKKDLESLVGKKLTEKDYREVIPMMGTPLEDLRHDEVDFEVFPNRPDLLSVEGFARAVQGFIGLKKGLPDYKINKSDYKVTVDRKLLGIRGCVAMAVVKGVKFDDANVAAFMQLQDKLAVTIGRRRKKLAMGAYDLDEIEFPLSYRAVRYKPFTPLGFDRDLSYKELIELHPKGKEFGALMKGWIQYPMYFDARNRVMCLIPITQAEFGKVTEKTKNILLEVTGTDWKAVFEVMNIMAAAMADRGGKLYEVQTIYPKKDVTAPNLRPWKITLDARYVNKLLDLDLKPAEIKAALEKMRFGVTGNNVFVPAYRTDVMHPIDLVEDIAIAHGYEKFEPRIPKIPTIAKPNPAEAVKNNLKNILVGLGFLEIVTFVLSNQEKEFSMMNRPKAGFAEIQNPKTEDYTMARTSLLPGLLETFAQNASSEMPQRIFEVGEIVEIDAKQETGAVNKTMLSAGILHSNANYSEMKAYLDSLSVSLGKKFQIKESKEPSFIQGRAVDIIVSGKKVGVLGEISPKVLSNFGIEYPVVVFEISAV